MKTTGDESGKIPKGITNQARRIANKKRGAVCPRKASRANETATDPTARASARYVC